MFLPSATGDRIFEVLKFFGLVNILNGGDDLYFDSEKGTKETRHDWELE